MSAPSRLPLPEFQVAEADEPALWSSCPDGGAEPRSLLVVGAGLFGETVAAVLSTMEMRGVWRGEETETAAAIAEHRPSLVFIEIPVWSDDHADRCRRLALSGLPVIVLLERGDSADRARALEAGAADCVSAPCAPSELAARVRRALYPATATSPVFGEWRLDVLSREVIGADRRRISLGPAELAVLRRLLLDRGRVTSVDALALAASSAPLERPLTVNHLRVLLHRLRAKLGRDSRGRQAIVCVRHLGYALSTAAEGSGDPHPERSDGVSPTPLPQRNLQPSEACANQPALGLLAAMTMSDRSPAFRAGPRLQTNVG